MAAIRRVRFRPIADIKHLSDASRMIRLASVAHIRIVAGFGATIWAIGAVYVLLGALAGAANLATPNFYGTMLVVLAGLVVNMVLFRNAETAGRSSPGPGFRRVGCLDRQSEGLGDGPSALSHQRCDAINQSRYGRSLLDRRCADGGAV